MGEPIEIKYFNWLCTKVLEKNKQEYRALMEILFETEFVWVVPADKHRVADGLELRYNYIRDNISKRDRVREHTLEEIPCSVLEVLLAFAKRANFQTDIPVKTWFWEFMTNLGLDKYNQVSRRDEEEIEEILYTFIWRIYEPDGTGGIFPMSQTHNDQREIEIWYQFAEYIDERGLL